MQAQAKEEGEAEAHIETWLYNLNEAPLPEEVKKKGTRAPDGYSVESERAMFDSLMAQQQGA